MNQLPKGYYAVQSVEDITAEFIVQSITQQRYHKDFIDRIHVGDYACGGIGNDKEPTAEETV